MISSELKAAGDPEDDEDEEEEKKKSEEDEDEDDDDEEDEEETWRVSRSRQASGVKRQAESIMTPSLDLDGC